MIPNTSFVAIAVLMLSSGWLVSAQEAAEGWRAFHDKIYATDSRDKLTPEQTREYLLKLRDMYTGSTDSGSRKRLTIVSNLLLIPEISKERCLDAVQMERLLEVADYDTAHVVNIVPYVEYYLRKQVDICKDQIEAQFKAAMDRMDPLTAAKLHRFAARISDELVDDPDRDLSPVVEQFLEDEKRLRDPNWYLRVDEAKQHDAEWYFETDVEPVCKDADEKLASIAYVGLLERRLTSQLDRVVVQILRKLHVMRRIVAQKYDIIQEMKDHTQ